MTGVRRFIIVLIVLVFVTCGAVLIRYDKGEDIDNQDISDMQAKFHKVGKYCFKSTHMGLVGWTAHPLA